MRRKRKHRSAIEKRYEQLCQAMVRNNKLHLSLRARLAIQAEALYEIARAPTLDVAKGLAEAAAAEVADEEWAIRKKICLGELP